MSEPNRTNIAILLTLAAITLVGAGCVSFTQKSTETATSQTISDTQDASRIEPTATKPTDRDCTKDATVTFASKDETNETWTIDLDGKRVGVLMHDGESALYPWLEVPGMTYLAFDPTGLGGYIPYGGHQTLVAVNHCTEMVTRFSPAGSENSLDLVSLSSDGNSLASVTMYEGTTGTQFSVRIWNTEDVLLPLIVNKSSAIASYDWTVPGDWAFVGSAVFNADGTKLAIAAGAGPDDEHSAIYSLNVKTGVFTQAAERTDGILYVKGWSTNDTIVTSNEYVE